MSEMQMQVSGFGDVQNRPDGNFQFSDKLQSVMVPLGRFRTDAIISASDRLVQLNLESDWLRALTGKHQFENLF